VLRLEKGGKAIPAQVVRDRGRARLTWLVNGLKAGAVQELSCHPVSTAPGAGGVTLQHREADGCVDVLVSGKLFTAYHYGETWVRPFLHPVIGPGGAHMTRSWPIRSDVPGETRDHPHHKSIWVAYGECGNVDNWAEEEGHGWQRHQRFERLVSGRVYGEIAAKNHWCHPGGRKQFEEARTLRFYNLPGGVRLFDIAVTFHMTEKAVTFRDTKEGGLVSVRVATAMDVENGGKIENGYGGIDENETWGKPAPWCDYSGTVGGQDAGIAIFDHETNPRYPTGWHVRNYGLMTANCFAWRHYNPEARRKGDMKFRKGQKTTWRYRLYIHRGDARKGKVRQHFLDYIAPPAVTPV
jgi:hypothetical protein